MQGRNTGLIVAIIAVAVLVIIFFGLLGGGMMMGYGLGPGRMMGLGFGYGGFGFGWIYAILMGVFWLLVIGGVIALVIWLLRPGRMAETISGPPTNDALQILRERYAKGEITKEQYDQMRQDLEGK